MRRKLILLISFVVMLGLVNSATAGVLVHFSFDGEIDANLPPTITDDTTNVTFNVFLDPCESESKVQYGGPNPWFNTGGTSARFTPDAGLIRHATGADILDLAGYQYTIEMFLKINTFEESKTALIKKYEVYYLDIDRTNDQAGKLQYQQAAEEDENRLESDANAIKLGTWYHIAAVFDACDPNEPQKLYIDGVKVDSNGTSARNPGTDVNVAIACMERPKEKDFSKDDWVDGWIDELRISDEALDPSGFLLSPGQMGKQASQPWPGYGDEDVCPNNVQLSWKPGEDVNDVNGHDVYFGTDYSDVRDANRTNHPGLLYYSEGQDSNEYPEDSNLPQLELMTTYYWRVDQVNDPNIYTGPVWEFTTEDGNARDPTPYNGLRGYNPTNVVLRWTPSCVASSQTVYFSTNLNDVNTMNPTAVNDVVGGDINNCPVVGTLEKFTYYYWRIKTTRSGAYGTGATKVWKFKTGFGGLLLYLPFDGTEDANLPATVTDSSGNDLEFTTFAEIYDPNATGSVKYGEPRFAVGGGTSANFDPNAGLYRPDPCGPNEPNVPDLLRLDGYQYTIEFWVKPENLSEDLDIDIDDPNLWLEEDWDLVLIGKYDSWMIGIEDPGENNTFRWQHNGESEDMYDDSAVVGEWAHIAAVYDRTDKSGDRMKFYLNGELVGTDGERDLNPPDNNYPVTIGYAYQDDVNVGRYFDGCIDEIRIWDIAYEPELEIATNPYPEDKFRPLEPNDANYIKFMWKPGKYVQGTAGHKIYFGTSIADVNESAEPNAIVDSNSWVHPPLELTKTYYWRVDEVNGTDVWPGYIWRFETRSLIVHPNMLVWYKLDQTEGEGRDVWDSSGRYFDAECDNTPHWEPNNGRFDGCMYFLMEHSDWDEDDQEWNWDEDPGNIEMDDDKTKKMAALINKEISISVWINGDPNQRRDEDMVVFEFCDDDYEDDINGDANKTKVLAVVPTEPTDTGYVAFRAGLYPQDYLVYTEGNPKAWRGSWQHFVFIKDENEGKMYIYLNNELVAFKEDCNTTSLVNVKGTGEPRLKLGAYVDNDDGYDGRMDDFQIYNIHLTEPQIEEIFRCGALGVSCPGLALAWSPSPYDGQGDVYHKADLSWEPGAYVADTDGHEVFFGTNYDEIAAANSAVPGPNVVHDTCSVTGFDPGPLELGQIYYWRIDEVNDPCTWTGRIWSFTVADFFIIEDFESYTDGQQPNPNPLTNGWEKVELCLPSLATEDEEWWVQPRGWKSLEYKGWSSSSPYYSEMQSKFVLDPNDWTILDNKMKILTLWFYGLSYLEGAGDTNPCTATERWWVELEDIDNDKGRVLYPTADATDFRQDEWLYWDIPLSDFNDANPDLDLNKLLKLHLGFGDGITPGVAGFTVVYWDDIRLAPAYCIPSKIKPQADISGPYDECDCQVDYYDLDLMAGQWLDSDCNCVEEYGSMTEPPEANLVAWYQFNDGSGSTATDSTSNDYHGTIEYNDVNVFWVTPGPNLAGYALEFDGGWVSVPNETTPKLNLTEAVTVCAWINLAEPMDDDMHVVVKGRNDKETYALELDDDGKLKFKVRKKSGSDENIDSDDKVPADEWVHIAGTCDGNNMTIYLNGQVEKSEQKGDLTPFLVDANDGLGIAERWGDKGTNSWYPFIGTIDDVRIYDCNLSGAEICYIASDGDGVAEMVKIANIFTDEPAGTPQAVNLKDFAVLMIEWLAKEQPLLWPE